VGAGILPGNVKGVGIMDGEAAASILIYGALGLIPLIYNYKAARKLENNRKVGGTEARGLYVVVEPRRIDLEELEALIGGDSIVGVVSRAEEAEA